MSSTPTYVVSRSRSRSHAYPGARFLRDVEPSTVGHLEAEHGHVLVLGSPATVVRMLESEALLELELAVVPAVVRHGRGLFDTATRPLTLAARTATVLDNGMVLLTMALAPDGPSG